MMDEQPVHPLDPTWEGQSLKPPDSLDLPGAVKQTASPIPEPPAQPPSSPTPSSASIPASPNLTRQRRGSSLSISAPSNFINVGLGVAVPPTYEGGKWAWRSKPPSGLSNDITEQEGEGEDSDVAGGVGGMDVEKKAEELGNPFQFTPFPSRPFYQARSRSDSIAMSMSTSGSRPGTPTDQTLSTSNGTGSGSESKELGFQQYLTAKLGPTALGSSEQAQARFASVLQSFATPSIPSRNPNTCTGTNTNTSSSTGSPGPVAFRMLRSYSFTSASLDNLAPSTASGRRESTPDLSTAALQTQGQTQRVHVSRRHVKRPNLLPKPRAHSRVVQQLESESLPPGKEEAASEIIFHRKIASLPGSPARLMTSAPLSGSRSGIGFGGGSEVKNRFPESWSDGEAEAGSSVAGGLRDEDSSDDGGFESAIGVQEEDEAMMDEAGLGAGDALMMDFEEKERRNSISSVFGSSAPEGVPVDRKGRLWTSYRERERSRGSPGIGMPAETFARPLKRKMTDDLLPSVSFKRRAVSPSASISSLSSSPILSYPRHSTPPIPPIALMPLSPRIGYASRSGSPALMNPSGSGSAPGVAGGVMAMLFQGERGRERHGSISSHAGNGAVPEDEEVDKLKI
ncbi:hypothetical protein BT69DRAFT_1319999 [Atractiella rhizophila]|nr:hypothetical protein BT69DRAFT_1319999 [Atractiella rhizophila]